MTLTVGSLFSGIGGMDLGLERAGFQVIWQCETDDYCRRVLEKHWPGVPKHGDIRHLDSSALAVPDLIAGGFPCQDISNAGKREGIGGKRSGLWSEFARLVGELRPRYVLVENVPALLGRGMGVVLGDLAAIGYDAEWGIVSAADVGAPHLRKRLFIVAYPASTRFPEGLRATGGAVRDEARRAQSERRSAEVANAAGAGPPEWPRSSVCGPQSLERPERCGRRVFLDPPGHSGAQWAVEPDVGRVASGIPARVDRLRGLGNAVVPQVAEYVGQCILTAAKAAAR